MSRYMEGRIMDPGPIDHDLSLPGDPAANMEKHYRAALGSEIERLEAEVAKREEKIARTEALVYSQAKDVKALEADVNGLHRKLELAERANDRLAHEAEAFTEADTVALGLTEEDRLELAHLEHRQDNLEHKQADLRNEVVRTIESRRTFWLWAGGAFFALVMALAVTMATFWPVSS